MDVHGEAAGLVFHPIQVLLAGGAIYHQPVVVVAFVDDQIVHYPAALVEHAGVEGAAGFDLVDVVGEQVAQVGAGVAAADVHHGHVGDVEGAGVLAHGMVLFQLGAIVDGHVPAAEIHHLAAGGEMGVVKGCAVTHGVNSLHIPGNGRAVHGRGEG